jgi:hypothetical protein
MGINSVFKGLMLALLSKYSLQQARSTFRVVQAKFGLHSGNIKFSTRNEE